MGRAEEKTSCNIDLGLLSIQGLVELYDGTIEELSRCAKIEPGLNDDFEEVELRESALLSLENKILKQFAEIQIHSQEDVLGVMDIWAKIASVQNDGFANPSDRIAMNIFRNMTSDKFFKG